MFLKHYFEIIKLINLTYFWGSDPVSLTPTSCSLGMLSVLTCNGFIPAYWMKMFQSHVHSHRPLRFLQKKEKNLLTNCFCCLFHTEGIRSEVLLYLYVSPPSVVLLMVSDGTGVQWPHMFIQGNNDAVVQAANTAGNMSYWKPKQYSLKASDITIYGLMSECVSAPCRQWDMNE